MRARNAVLVKTVELEKEQSRDGQAHVCGSGAGRQAARGDRESPAGRTDSAARKDEFEAARQLLAIEIAELRKQGVAETTIAAIEAEKREDIVRREVEAALALRSPKHRRIARPS